MQIAIDVEKQAQVKNAKNKQASGKTYSKSKILVFEGT